MIDNIFVDIKSNPNRLMLNPKTEYIEAKNLARIIEINGTMFEG